MERGSLYRTGLMDGEFQPEFTAYYFKQWEEWDMSFHRHDSTEIMYILSGVCRVEVRVPERPSSVGMQLKKGEFILLDAGVPHRLIVEGHSPCRILNIEFRFAPCSGRFPSLRQCLEGAGREVSAMLTRPFYYLLLRDPEEIYRTLKSLVLELDRQHADEGPSPMVRLLFAELLISLSRLREENESGNHQEMNYYVKQCLGYLHENYDREIRVEDAAGVVNLHPGYLQRIFKLHTGETLMQYLTRLRMDKAAMLLLHTNIPVADIADYVGVGSRQYFHALFKKHMGATPIEYRNSLHAQKVAPDVISEDF
ncbi:MULTISPECIES: AraC family transcriptional regulator [Paenibacillus]|uniref:AraC family transcriptional regulator n=1 Tax=Paenibacillus TaxID=44249 RepID=UPI002FE1579B